MASNFFQNYTVDLNTMWYDSHAKLVKRLTAELGCPEKTDELIEKFLAKPLKIKKQQDPNMPKRPKTSFILYCDDHRKKVMKKNPKIKMGEVMKELSKMWKSCSESSKKKYVDLAKKAKEEYEEKMEEYQSNNCYE